MLPVPVLATPPERVRFGSLAEGDGAPVRLEALLFRPGPPAPPEGRPAVIALHGCGGLYSGAKSRADRLSQRHQAFAEAQVAAGYVVLFPDSLGPRGLAEICRTPMRERTLTAAQRRLDALGALAWLARQPGVDPRRIALVGWSHGGSTVLATVDGANASVTAFRDAKGAPPFFRTAIAFYPGCSPALRDAKWRPATSLAILIGAADDWTPARPCEELAVRGREARWPLEVVVYPGAYHGFDAPSGEVRLRRDVPNGVRPGEGVHVGPDRVAREDANRRVQELLYERLGH